MIPYVGEVDLEAVSERLVELAYAQAHAIESDDWAEFDRLSVERDDVQGMLDLFEPGAASRQVVERLEHAVRVDTITAGFIRGQESETSAAAGQAQRVQTALRGYGRPSTEPASALLDTQR